MNKTNFEFYHSLKSNGYVQEKRVPITIRNSDTFNGLIQSQILGKIQSGRGFRYVIQHEELFESFFQTHFPESIVIGNKSDNVRKYRNSKVEKTISSHIFLLRGYTHVEVNHQSVDLQMMNETFGVFSCDSKIIAAQKICLVENLDIFFIADRLFGLDYVYVHKYGRIGKQSIQYIQSDELLVFVDYDYNGLDEYLRIKACQPHATLYVPENYEELFLRYSKSLENNQAKMSHRLKNTTDELVIKIRDSVTKANRFLEQQFWRYD